LNVLVPNTTDPATKAKLISEAIDGYLQYATITVPIIKHNAASQNNNEKLRMPGYDSIQDARQKIAQAVEIASPGVDIYRKLGDSAGADALAAKLATLRASFAA
jgi:hypothetical protein